MRNEDFIMLPTVDFCFQKLMENPKVRRGFVAALMRVHPDKIQETKLLPTLLHGETAEEKLGILDVRVLMTDGTQLNLEMQVRYFEYWDERALFYLGKMFVSQLKKGDDYEKLKKCIHVSILDFVRFPGDDVCYRTLHFRDDRTGEIYSDKMEIQILELQKLPRKLKEEEGIVEWMRFFGGKNRKEMESMTSGNEYIEEAYNTLVELSADDRKRLEYEAREKALRDYNSQMNSARRQGIREGIRQGELRGELKGELKGRAETKCIFKLYMQGSTEEEIARECGVSVEKVREILE